MIINRQRESTRQVLSRTLNLSEATNMAGSAGFKRIAKKHGYEKGDEVDTKQHGRGEIWYPKSGTGHVFIFKDRAMHQAKGMDQPLFNNPETWAATPDFLDKHLAKVHGKTESAEPMKDLKKRAMAATREAKKVNTPEAHMAASALHKECGDRILNFLSVYKPGQGYSTSMGMHGDYELHHKEQAQKLGKGK